MFVAVAVSLFGLSGCATVEPFSGESVDVAIEQMLHAVSEAAGISASRSESTIDLELSEIIVTLETVGEWESSSYFTLWVVTFDATREKEYTQQISVALKPQKDDNETTAKSEDDITSPHKKMVKALAKGFDAAYLAASGAKEGVKRSGDKALETSEIVVKIEFTLVGSASAEPTIEIFGIDLTSSKTGTRENVHQIELKFTPKSS